MAPIDGINAVKCADCARSDSAVTDLRPSQRVQIPMEAMTGHLDEVPRQNRYNRRASGQPWPQPRETGGAHCLGLLADEEPYFSPEGRRRGIGE